MSGWISLKMRLKSSLVLSDRLCRKCMTVVSVQCVSKSRKRERKREEGEREEEGERVPSPSIPSVLLLLPFPLLPPLFPFSLLSRRKGRGNGRRRREEKRTGE